MGWETEPSNRGPGRDIHGEQWVEDVNRKHEEIDEALRGLPKRRWWQFLKKRRDLGEHLKDEESR
jgi:hypothetical protein